MPQNDDLKTGWLSPTGDFHPCYSYDHISEARSITGKFKYSECKNPDEELMNAGWVYIGISSFMCHEWRIGWRKFLTDYQINFLKPYFEDSLIPVNDYAVLKWKREVEKDYEYGVD